MRRRWLVIVAGVALWPSVICGQTEFRYVNQSTGPNQFALGFPPPIPRQSSTPLDGFRSYESLHARHQDLMLQHEFISGQVVGTSRLGAPIWAYVIGDADTVTRNAGPEPSILINGGIHAREWGTPELTTGLLEAAVAGAGDGWLWDYLIDTLHFTVLPVNNIDGFRQTQRFPTQVLVGADPRFPDRWPRDGRMRRKNLRDADEMLSTLGDHLNGVDLNRNFDPFWGGDPQTSNPVDLVYRGPAPFSEPESQALLAAAQLARPDRLRWYQDTHSFTQVILSVNTFNTRRNVLQTRLASTFSEFHNALSVSRHGTQRRYPNSPSQPGGGIGVTTEYFAYTYEIPSWTLEIEPQQSAAEYGGLGTEHDGFILPDSEVRRLRDDMALTHAVVAYQQSGPPSVAAVSIRDEHDGEVYGRRWTYSGPGQRALVTGANAPLVAGLPYRLEITFDKPMRWMGASGATTAPGIAVDLHPRVRLLDETDAVLLELDSSTGQWLDGSSGQSVGQWRFDRWRLDFVISPDQLPAPRGIVRLEIQCADFTGQALDANPATVVDWSGGEWSGYENSAGVPGLSGGADRSLSLRVAVTAAEARRWLLADPPEPPERAALIPPDPGP